MGAKPNKQNKDRQPQAARVAKPQKAQRQARSAPKQHAQSPAKRSVARSASQATRHRAEVRQPHRPAAARVAERAQKQGPRSNVRRELPAQPQANPQRVARERQGSKQRAEVRRQLQADQPHKKSPTADRVQHPRSSIQRQPALTDEQASPNEGEVAPQRPRIDKTSPIIADREARTPRENRHKIRRNLAQERNRTAAVPRSKRPAREARPERWANERRNYANNWKKWDGRHAGDLQKFRRDRAARWNRIASRDVRANVVRDYRSTAISNWRRDVVDYRRERAIEVWDRSRDLCDDYFDDHWWRYAWWNPHPGVIVDVSPWWWWRPATWTGITAFFGPTWSPAPVYYDPGVSVVYEGDEVYIGGGVVGSVADYNQQSYALDNPGIEVAPVPATVAEGRQAEWLPLGVWAFTQEREGDAVMFFQMSIDKNGIVGGAFKNVLTGEEQPIVGKLDRTTQRVAWHVGDLTETVYDTYLPNLTEDVASVFVHLDKNQTQTWLMVRLPSPEMPPGTVKIPRGAELSAR
jgi:hypothetical protein